MKSSKSLIELHLSGKGASYLIDAVLEELPPVNEIRTTILNDLPKGSKIRFEQDRTCYITCQDRHLLAEMIVFYERVYPEVEFVAEKLEQPFN
jgi:hypothetical protein